MPWTREEVQSDQWFKPKGVKHSMKTFIPIQALWNGLGVPLLHQPRSKISFGWILLADLFQLSFFDKINKWRYLVRVTLNSRADKPDALIFRVNLKFCVLVFMEGGKPKNPEKNLNNKLNPHVTPDSGIKPGPKWWEASALTTSPSFQPHPCHNWGLLTCLVC